MMRVFGSCWFAPEDFTSVGKILSLETVGEVKRVPLDVGASSMIINGQIKVKSGPNLEGFDETCAVFDDGSKIEADVVVLATG